jgi:hypothetical protein
VCLVEGNILQRKHLQGGERVEETSAFLRLNFFDTCIRNIILVDFFHYLKTKFKRLKSQNKV